MADPKVREAAVASIEQACPRCGAPREPRQDYCVECGLRLPRTTGIVSDFRRRWIRRFGWYPGDWVWSSLLGLIVAVAGAAVAIVLTSHEPNGGTTIIASPPSAQTTAGLTTAATTTDKLPTPPEPTTTKAAATTTKTTTTPITTTVTSRNGETVWPTATNGWTVVLLSYPVAGGHAAPAATAKRAAQSGLAEVGVLDSAAWSSLHPGYYVVFSGIYPSNTAAQATVARVRAKGFSAAYVRQIAR
jgi:hypothetical protein